MDLQSRIAEQVAKLPPELKELLDAELAAGNQLKDLEIGRDQYAGRVFIVLDHPFRAKREASPPPGVGYRESQNKHLLLFEFHTADRRFALLTAKFKPMKLDPLPPGPPNPTDAHIKRMEEINRRNEEAAAARHAAALAEAEADRIARAGRAAQDAKSIGVRPTQRPGFGDAANRFLNSMVMTFDMWHDGLGYDLDALKQIPPSERDAVESILLDRHPQDWRDVEALAQIDSPRAQAAVQKALKNPDPHVRHVAMQYYPQQLDPADRERLLIQTLRTKGLYEGLSSAIDEAAEFHPPAVVDALFQGALSGDGEGAVHFAALLFYIHGKAKEPFDWDHRPFFLRFNTSNRNDRRAAFAELCQTVGADVNKYMR